MRILMLTPRLPHAQSYSGMQMVYQRMARLIERGHQVGLACFIDEQQDRPYIDRLHSGLHEVEILREPRLNQFLPGAFTQGRYSAPSSFFRYQSRRMSETLGRMVHQGRYDVAIAEFTAMGLFFLENPYLPAVRRMISCHDSPTLGSRKRINMIGAGLSWGRQWLEYRHMRYLEFRLYRAVDRVLTLTNEERMALLEEDPTVRITAVSPGLRCETFLPLPDEPKEHAILITGRFSSEQTQYGALWFMRNVWPVIRRRDPDVKLYLVGRDPTPAMNHIGGRDDRIIITGVVEDLRPYLARAKVYACPALSGSGVRGKVLEAMAMELPVVSTLVGSEGIPILQGNNGYLADSPSVMADLIYMLLHDDEQCRRLGKHARETIESQFTWSNSMDLLEQVLRDVVSKRSYHNVT
ncbi:MAG: glycosyltransferase [Verrucomicrobia bacterium]|nr:glycosyltransferase [Verrucomicrobiota bacterium]MCH8514169.1 glycosyltransferase [Kiritimatiellia bacterium]